MSKVGPRHLSKLLAAGMHVEIGEPFPLGGGHRYMCLAKVVGRKYEMARITAGSVDTDGETEQTQTLCVVSEEGATAEQARERLMARLHEARLDTTMPPPPRPRRGWLGRLIAAFK